MEDIKLRIWDKARNKMIYAAPIRDLLFGYGNNFDHTKGDDAPIMQFTGLTDKDGVDIYEGDIVLVEYNHLGKITVSFSDGKFNVSNYCLAKCKVIGNIHENS